MYVTDNFRHLSIGQKLISLAEEWARQKNCRQLASNTELENTRSIQFHLKSGCTEGNRIVCFTKRTVVLERALKSVNDLNDEYILLLPGI